MDNSLKRFTDAQENSYPMALSEIQQGRKQSHWMWFIFPQIAGLGFSEMSKFYAINDLTEARLYLEHPVLGTRLIEISKALLDVKGKTANQVFGSPDDMKLKSCMTLYSSLENADPVFESVLTKYFSGIKDEKTLQLMR
jgi:uncharacterized protein (DUF1810 family)